MRQHLSQDLTAQNLILVDPRLVCHIIFAELLQDMIPYYDRKIVLISKRYTNQMMLFILPCR